MSDTKKRSVDDRIKDVERRLELRRGRIEYNAQEIKATLSRKSTWVPLGAAAGAIAIGYAVARARSQEKSARTLYMPRRVYEERKAGMVATILGLAGGIARIALSPQGRLLWQAFRRGIQRGREYARWKTSAKGVRRGGG